MNKMNFGARFCSWINMLHKDAQTRFLLCTLTDSIDVTFFIRQGDPISMILFIIFIEPFLRFLEKNLAGLHVCGIHQVVEAFCDDVNVFTNNDDDLRKVDMAVTKFEV